MVPGPVQVLQILVVLALAPLYAGVLTRAEAIVASKRGPSVLQPYRDLAKLRRKGSAVSDQVSWVFRRLPAADADAPAAGPGRVAAQDRQAHRHCRRARWP